MNNTIGDNLNFIPSHKVFQPFSFKWSIYFSGSQETLSIVPNTGVKLEDFFQQLINSTKALDNTDFLNFFSNGKRPVFITDMELISGTNEFPVPISVSTNVLNLEQVTSQFASEPLPLSKSPMVPLIIEPKSIISEKHAIVSSEKHIYNSVNYFTTYGNLTKQMLMNGINKIVKNDDNDDCGGLIMLEPKVKDNSFFNNYFSSGKTPNRRDKSALSLFNVNENDHLNSSIIVMDFKLYEHVIDLYWKLISRNNYNKPIPIKDVTVYFANAILRGLTKWKHVGVPPEEGSTLYGLNLDIQIKGLVFEFDNNTFINNVYPSCLPPPSNQT